MLRSLFRPKAPTRAEILYPSLVEKARAPRLYQDFGVPDHFDGRFDMLVLHVFLFCYQHKGQPLAQEVFDLFLDDMDRTLREIGVGDISVPKKLKAMTQAFYGRVQAYDEAVGHADPEMLVLALARNTAAEKPDLLAGYVRDCLQGSLVGEGI